MSKLQKSRVEKTCISAFSLLLLVLYITPGHAERNWQQRVDYVMDITLVDSTRSVEGSAEITYVNHSPDTLGSLWFRLPPDALRKDSPKEQVLFRGRKGRLDRVPEEDWGGLTVHRVESADRSALFMQDGSIGRLVLEPPLEPGDTTVFTLEFTTRFPTGRASFRIAYTNGQYKGAYWYPMICPYTPTYGWTTNRYFGTGEAYGEFGDFDIRYHVPYKYIVASTGELVNEDEVLPAERMAGLALDNPDPIPIPEGAEGERPVTWVYRAENVPDVAFAMDPRFLIDRVVYEDEPYEAWAFVRRGRQQEWADAAEVCGWTIQQLEEIYGGYPWPRVTATDSWSAMEYPMLTMMSWETPHYHYVMMHEVIHNYTPFILHSSSVDAPVLDEGFTTFVEHVLAERYAGTPWNREREFTRGLFSKTFTIRNDVIRGKRPYLEAVLDGEDLPMVRGADVAEDYTQLRVSTYYKAPVMLSALRSVVGEERFWQGMKTYYRNHKLTHVSIHDMTSSFVEGTEQPLDWFFDQFLYDDGDIDYALGGLHVEQAEEGWQVEFDVKRKGKVRLPLRFAVVTAAGDTALGELPFLLTDPPLKEYQRWGSWDQLHQPEDEHRVAVLILADERPVEVILDPYDRYTDRDPMDDRLTVSAGISLRRGEILWDWGMQPLPPLPVDKQRLEISPAFGYHQYFKFGLGLSLRSSFMDKRDKTHMILLVSQEEPSLDLEPHQQDFSGAARPRLHASASATVPIGTGFHPVDVVVQLGHLYDMRWGIVGLQRGWRSWSQRENRHKVAITAGSVEKMPFANGMYEVSSSIGTGRWSRVFRVKAQTSLQIKGMNQYPYSLAQAELACSGPIGRGWQSGFEFRQVLGTAGTPSLFQPRLAYGAPYNLLEHPVFSTAWSMPHGVGAIPRPFATGALTAFQTDFASNRFTVVRLSADRGLPGNWRQTSSKPLNKLLDKIHYGVFGATAYVPYPESPEHSDYSFGVMEAGFELKLEALYGLTVHWRVAPFARAGKLFANPGASDDEFIPGGTQDQVHPYDFDWQSDDWFTKSVILVQLNTGLLFK